MRCGDDYATSHFAQYGCIMKSFMTVHISSIKWNVISISKSSFEILFYQSSKNILVTIDFSGFIKYISYFM